MYKDQITKVSSDEVDLPQIRFPVKGTMTAEEMAGEQDDINKLTKIVEDAFGAIANATGLSNKEVLDVMEDLHIEMLGDVLTEGIHADKLKKGVDMEALEEGIQDAIKVISLATDLDTQQISDAFTEKKNTSINDLAKRLHDSSQSNREKFGSTPSA